MLPAELTADRFTKYPPEARALAVQNLPLLKQLPLAFEPLLLREVISYDWKFPAERRELDHQFSYLNTLSPADLGAAMQPFSALQLSPALAAVDWVNEPNIFSERFTAHLWATHQIEQFRSASVAYVQKLDAAAPLNAPALPRLGIAIIGQGVSENQYPLFRKLRPYGAYWKNVDHASGYQDIFNVVKQRAAAHPEKFAHWYIDGASGEPHLPPQLTTVAYTPLGSVRRALVDRITAIMQPGGGGPEVARTTLAQIKPEDLGMHGEGDAEVLNRFQISVLTEGSGTQLFSTTFVQWSAREVLRRAQPLTLLARFTPRQREDSMRDMLAGAKHPPVPDPAASLIDADMGAFYTWINLQRLADRQRSRFLVWFEGHGEALAIGPGFKAGAVDSTRITMQAILAELATAS